MAPKLIGEQIRAQAFIDVPQVPLGGYLQPTACSKSLKGYSRAPLFWNLEPA